MTLVGFNAMNHPQQINKRGARPEIDDRATSPEVFGPLHERFDFTIDVAALPRNAKCKRYFTPEENGLAKSWAHERVWCNPPYSSIEPWLEKAHGEWLLRDRKYGGPELIVMLLPANRTEQGWWQRQVEPHRDLWRRFARRVPTGTAALHRPRRDRDQAERAPTVRLLSADLGQPSPPAPQRRGQPVKRTPLARKTPLRARPQRHTPSLAERVWKEPTSGICQCGCGEWAPRLHRHHVLLRQIVRREGGAEWAHANAMLLHPRCHELHHSGARKIRMEVVPPQAIEFAVELLGPGAASAYFSRRYAAVPESFEEAA